jgi:hypothetical protein
VEVTYPVDSSDPLMEVAVDGVALPAVRVADVDATAIDLEVDGLRRRVAVTRDGDVVDCDSPLGHTQLVLRRLCYEA